MEQFLRIALIEDDSNYKNQIDDFLKRFFDDKNKYSLSYYENAERFLAEFRDGSFNLIFFDIELGDINGMQAAKKVRKIDEDVIIIFETNIAQYALEGYEVNALDFLVKPYSYEDFRLKLLKALRNIKDDAFIVIDTRDNEKVKLKYSEIGFIETDGHYLIFHVGEKTYSVRGSVKNIEEDFSKYYFYKINSGYLVNMRQIQEIKEDEVVVNNQKLLISRRRKQDFLIAFTRFVGGMKWLS